MYTHTNTNDTSDVLTPINNESDLFPQQIVFALTKAKNNNSNETYGATFDTEYTKLNDLKPNYLRSNNLNSSEFWQMSLVLYTNDPLTQQELKFDLIAFL